jgi:methylase of polypeptide subunit release factors
VSEDFDAKVSLMQARAALLAALKAVGYRFVAPTPLTHARVIARRPLAQDVRDILGWSLPFRPDVADQHLLALLDAAGALESAAGGAFKSKFRVASSDGDLFLHSAFPTTQHDAVFFGPDSYRFAAFVRAELPGLGPRRRAVDIGAGSGVGAVAAARSLGLGDGVEPPPRTIVLTDINPAALELAQANLAAAAPLAAEIEYLVSDGLDDVAFTPDLIIANPPYIADPAHRAYRDGGGMHGGEASLAWARAAAQRLQRGGAFLLYTGSAIVDGRDELKQALLSALSGFDVNYREIDPDVFGEELEREDYADVERIAVVGLVATKR